MRIERGKKEIPFCITVFQLSVNFFFVKIRFSIFFNSSILNSSILKKLQQKKRNNVY